MGDERIDSIFTEAPYSANVYLVHPSGARVLQTVRARTMEQGVGLMNALISECLAKGWVLDGQQPLPGNEPQWQICQGYMVIRKGEKYSVELPFLLSNGEKAAFPKTLVTTPAIELFKKDLSAAGVNLKSVEFGKFYPLPIKVTWKRGNQIPDSNPPKYYTDWLSFTVERQENHAPPQPEPEEEPAF